LNFEIRSAVEADLVEMREILSAAALRAASQVRRYESSGWYADERAFVRPV